MAKFILFTNGTLSARFDSEINGDNIPPDAIEVSDDVFFKTINEQDGDWKFVDNEIVKLPFQAPAIDQLIANKLASIASSCEAEMIALTGGYPDAEILSWSKQEMEARAYMLDNAASTPLIDALATARGIAKLDLAERIIAKADAFASYSGALIGKRQGLEDQLQALLTDLNNSIPVTTDQVMAISW